VTFEETFINFNRWCCC